jgi:pullulanase-type alpha-1,6-glucosidase
VVYNHTFIAGQNEKSVLDRIVPGYYHRLNPAGVIERSTCCDNTATENLMMGKLMIDSAVLWATQYGIDSFRFDLMGHQPRGTMLRLQERVNAAARRKVPLIGEGWNFGEVADGARFVQASQLSLNGTGIGTFNDRLRDAVRGGSAGDAGKAMVSRQGYINGLVYDPNAKAGRRPAEDLLRTADMVRAGLAGSIRSYALLNYKDSTVQLREIDYGGQPAGYASEPSEVVNYVENHDNQTLFDIDVLKLPISTSGAERARVQVLGMAFDAFSQGVAYFHAGIDTLRSKSLDRNSFNSGDWFNRIDWSYRDNYFGTGLPPFDDNGKDWPLLKPLLANAAIKPTPADIALARDAFRDLLRIRASSTLFRLRSAEEIKQRLRFFNTGSRQEPTVIAAHLDGRRYEGARFAGISYFVNVDKVAHTVVDEQGRGKRMRLHPVHLAKGAADKRAAMARYDTATGRFTIPPRTAVVFVE